MGAVQDTFVGAAISSAPVLAGRLVARRGIRRGHLAALVVIATASLAIGVWAYAEHFPEVPDSRALVGGVLAAVFVGLLPLTAYFEIGFWVRSRIALLIVVAVTAVPLLCYGFVVLLIVSSFTNCTAGQYECPI